MTPLDLRLSAAIALGKLATAASRVLGLGGGTTMPGRVARWIDPAVVRRLASTLRYGSIIVTGTNGKTTTARLISHILNLASLVSVHNRAGANLAAGIAAALVQQTTWRGGVDSDVGIFEVDEATLPLVFAPLAPRLLVLTNLFRDQLDRYGEIDLVSMRWRTALQTAAAAATTVIFNADDPLVAEIGVAHGRTVVPFGIDDESCGLGTIEHAADARYCYRCGIPYRYAAVYFGHMGVYRCERCGTRRPELGINATEVVNRGIDGTVFTMRTLDRSVRVRTVLPGIYNIHNILAAAACCLEMNVSLETVARGVETFAPAFGRSERVRVDGREAILLLAKNPAGFNEVLRSVLRTAERQVVLIAINDLIADGRDISWLWDVDFEVLAGRAGHVVVSGIRAADMALRLKYAGVPETQMAVNGDLSRALDAAVQAVQDGQRLYILLTYTALLQLRRILERRGLVREFWEQ